MYAFPCVTLVPSRGGGVEGETCEKITKAVAANQLRESQDLEILSSSPPPPPPLTQF